MTKLKFKSDIFKSFNKLLHKFFIIFFLYIYKSLKIRKTTKKAHERYQNLSKEEKEKRQQYGCEHYKKSLRR